MKCNKCDGTVMYLGSFKSHFDLIIGGKLLYDKNIPDITFMFNCRCCDNKIIVDWEDNKMEVVENYGTEDVLYYSYEISNIHSLFGRSNDFV